jgi:hypothetical protein
MSTSTLAVIRPVLGSCTLCRRVDTLGISVPMTLPQVLRSPPHNCHTCIMQSSATHTEWLESNSCSQKKVVNSEKQMATPWTPGPETACLVCRVQVLFLLCACELRPESDVGHGPGTKRTKGGDGPGEKQELERASDGEEEGGNEIRAVRSCLPVVWDAQSVMRVPIMYQVAIRLCSITSPSCFWCYYLLPFPLSLTPTFTSHARTHP